MWVESWWRDHEIDWKKYNFSSDLDLEAKNFLSDWKIDYKENEVLKKILVYNKNKNREKLILKNTTKENLEKLKNSIWINFILKEYLTKILSILDTKEFKDSKNINDLNQKFETENNFRNRYWKFNLKLESMLWLPRGILTAITSVESNYWTNLNSKTWSKWLMQLTIWPFKDMQWDTSKWKGLDNSKVSKYQKVFQKINIEDLKEIEIWNNKKIKNTIWEDTWDDLKKITSQNISISEIKQIIKNLQSKIKWKNKKEYHHTLNIIIWAVYFSYLYNKNWKNIRKTAISYNWDNKIVKWMKYKYIYWKKIERAHKKEKKYLDKL